MGKISTIYIANHTHTDIGFTDHQDVALEQHFEFIDQAIDLCEYSADLPDECRYRWVCEVTGITEQWLNRASSSQVTRFLQCVERGQIEVTGMQWNFAPTLSPEQMVRSLEPIERLRKRYGITVKSAVQSDSNGVSWMFADLLSAAGVDILTMAVNPGRGGVPKPVPQAFWWEGPSGRRLLTWNGYHYLFGRSNAKLGDWRYVDRFLPGLLANLEADEDYPWDFLYCQSTHPTRVDNGPPDARMIEFVRQWNAENREPRLAFSTPTELASKLTSSAGDIPVRTGEWPDWWADGVASSAFETGVHRQNQSMVLAASTVDSWRGEPGCRERIDKVFDLLNLYDEHTWGSFASAAAHASPWTKAQWNYKASFAYRAYGMVHDVLTRSARQLASEIGSRDVELRFNVGDLAADEVVSGHPASELLVINTLPWQRVGFVEQPEVRGGTAPVGVLESFVPKNMPWGGLKPSTPSLRRKVTLPAFGYAFVELDHDQSHGDLAVDHLTIENRFYRLTVDPHTGGLASIYDKRVDREFAGRTDEGWLPGELVYQRVADSAEGSAESRSAYDGGTASPGRTKLNAFWDFSCIPDFGSWNTDVAFSRDVPSEVTVSEPVICDGRATVKVECMVRGARGATCVYWLDSEIDQIGVEWEIDKEYVNDAEELFVAFPFALGEPSFRGDVNGVPVAVDDELLAGTVRDWFPIQGWIDVSDGEAGVTVAPLDAPLVQLGGITSYHDASRLQPQGATIMSYAMTNHNTVNWKSSQGGIVPLRYVLRTHPGHVDVVQAGRFAAEVRTPPIVLRDYVRQTESSQKSFLAIESGDGVFVYAENDILANEVKLHVRSIVRRAQTVTLDVTGYGVARARLVGSAGGRDDRDLPLSDGQITFPIAAADVVTVTLTRAEN